VLLLMEGKEEIDEKSVFCACFVRLMGEDVAVWVEGMVMEVLVNFWLRKKMGMCGVLGVKGGVDREEDDGVFCVSGDGVLGVVFWCPSPQSHGVEVFSKEKESDMVLRSSLMVMIEECQVE